MAFGTVGAPDALLNKAFIIQQPGGGAQAPVGPTHTPPPALNLASRGLPVYASNEAFYPASNATDADYRSMWRSVAVPPQWVALDLSGVPTKKADCLFVWYNDMSGEFYNPAVPAALPYTYTLEGNNQPGGGAPPGSGWQTILTVPANLLTNRGHHINLASYNWVRMNVSVTHGQTGATDDLELQIDAYGVAGGGQDHWLFLGDSITQEAMNHRNLDGSAWNGGPLATLIETATGRTPCYRNGGNGGQGAAFGVANWAALTADFTGGFIVLGYGTNDANALGPLSQPTIDAWHANMLTLVDNTLALGAKAVIPKMPWGNAQAGTQANCVTLNNVIETIYGERPSVVRGPDLYAFFFAHQNLIRDGLHPTYDTGQPAGMYGGYVGYEWWMRLWRDALIQNVY